MGEFSAKNVLDQLTDKSFAMIRGQCLKILSLFALDYKQNHLLLVG